MIQRTAHGGVVDGRAVVFQITEYQTENRPEQQQLDMPELVGINFAQSKIPIIHLFSSELTPLLYIYIGARFGTAEETVTATRPSSASYVLRLPGSG